MNPKPSWYKYIPRIGALSSIVKTLNAIQFFLANGKGENGIYLIEDGMGSFRIGNIGGGNSGGAEWPIYFGNGGITGMSVRVLRGLVKFGGVNYTIPQTDVLVSGGNAESPTYGYLRFGLQTDVGLIESSTTATMPVDTIGDDTYFEMPIFEAYIDKGTPRIACWCWTGVIKLDGFFSP